MTPTPALKALQKSKGTRGGAECDCKCCRRWRAYEDEILAAVAAIATQHEHDTNEAMRELRELAGVE